MPEIGNIADRDFGKLQYSMVREIEIKRIS